MIPCRTLPLLTLLSVLFATASYATTHVVDPGGNGDFLSIQPALTFASSGDTITVAAGTYTGSSNKNLSFGGKDLVLLSTTGAANTIIDGEGSGFAFSFTGGESSAAIVDGFTITRAPDGSPIQIVGSSPSIRGCLIVDNAVSTNAGGGVYIDMGSPTFTNCDIVENSNSIHGGGVFVSNASPSFENCSIIGNSTLGRGGGLWLENSTASLTSCTVAGNRANESESAFEGGGLILTGTSSVALAQTILWGNRANNLDEMLVSPASNATIDCSNVDTGGIGGPGSIIYGGDNLFGDPHFCLPAYCRVEPWTSGDYFLAANSPCLASNNPCGVLIGARGEGCPAVSVWTGGAGTDAFTDPANWSTGLVPGPGDQAQVTQGSVVLSSSVSVESIVLCSESDSSDTFTIANGAILTLGDPGPTLRKAEPRASTTTTQVRAEQGEILFPCPPYCGGMPQDIPWEISELGVLVAIDATLSGLAPLLNRGLIIIENSGTLTVDGVLDNAGIGIGRGQIAVNGNLAGTGEIFNSGDLIVSAGASITLTGDLVNRANGVVSLTGDAAGAGNWYNAGSIVRLGAGSSSFLANLVNQRGASTGSLQVSSGGLSLGGSLLNQGDFTVYAGSTLNLSVDFQNLQSGLFVIRGDVTGTGSIENSGTLQRLGAGSSNVATAVSNRLDSTDGSRGRISVDGGTLNVSDLTNEGAISTGAGANLGVTSSFANLGSGSIEGAGNLDVTSVNMFNAGSVSPGFSPGALGLTGSYASIAATRFHVELGGLIPAAEHDQLNVSGSASLAGVLDVELVDGFVPMEGDAFTIVTHAPGGSGAGFDCFSGTQLPGGLVLVSDAQTDAYVLVATDTTPTNLPPVAVPDSVSTTWTTPVTIPLLANEIDPDGDALRLVMLDTSSTLGTAYVDSGATTATYFAPEQYVGEDSFDYFFTDCNGARVMSSAVIDVTDPTASEPVPTTTATIALHPNVPNPFNPRTRLRFDIATAGRVRLVIYDAMGRRVRVLSDTHLQAGTYVRDWAGRDDGGRLVTSGVYFARLQANGETETRKLVLLR